MNVIICVDDHGGMLFNNRRQSRDVKVIEDICSMTEELWLHPFSEKLFLETAVKRKVNENFLEMANQEEFCFVENKRLAPIEEKIETLIIYKWNRVYPSDMKCDISGEKWELKEICEFEGKSHKKITKEVYKRN